MRAAGQLKLREEADSLSLELGTVSRGELVKVEQVRRVQYRVVVSVLAVNTIHSVTKK